MQKLETLVTFLSACSVVSAIRDKSSSSPDDGVESTLSELLKKSNISTSPCGNTSDFIRDVEGKVLIFYEHLRVFVDEKKFHYHRFEQNVGDLMMEFSRLEAKVDDLSSSQKLSQQFGFVKNVFYVMSRASEKLTFCNASRFPLFRLLYKIIDSNVRALVLYDSWGNPDISISRFSDRVRRLWQSLNSWETQHRGWGRVGDKERRFLDAETLDATETIGGLMTVVVKSGDS